MFNVPCSKNPDVQKNTNIYIYIYIYIYLLVNMVKLPVLTNIIYIYIYILVDTVKLFLCLCVYINICIHNF